MFNLKEKEFNVVSCGEIIMRLSPENGKILSQEGPLKRYLGGAELNVVGGISSLGGKAAFLSKIPTHNLGTYAKNSINTLGVNSNFLVSDDSKNSRLAVYYYEYGSSPRKPNVVYDRDNSSFQNFFIEEIDPKIYSKTNIFHTSGISLGLCKNSKELTKNLIKNFKEKNTLISFDVNFRRNLWGEEQNAKIQIEEILPHIDILFASDETFRKMFGETGDIQNIMKHFAEKYNLSLIISSQRTINSPNSHNFTCIIYDAINNEFITEKPYKNIEVVDRIGSGDAFVAGILYGLSTFNNPKLAIKYGNAMGAFKNTLKGDIAFASKEIIDSIISDHEYGSTSEMNR